jgi:demethylmenaquinone methyltransferase/2-methoxy-6-polyprenyl-1,4-benzoquinol methylase
MVLDLAFGKRVYDWLGEHEGFYKAIRWIACLGREQTLERLAIAAIGLKPGDTVLDLACGAGVNLPYLEDRVGPEGRILAVDYSEGMLNAARARAESRGWRNVEFVQADAARLVLASGSLDGAVCTFGLSAMPGERSALSRVAAALKADAKFVALDAKTFTGPASILNVFAGPLFKYTTNWDHKKDVIRVIREVFGEAEIVRFNSGCNFIAIAGPRRTAGS